MADLIDNRQILSKIKTMQRLQYTARNTKILQKLSDYTLPRSSLIIFPFNLKLVTSIARVASRYVIRCNIIKK